MPSTDCSDRYFARCPISRLNPTACWQRLPLLGKSVDFSSSDFSRNYFLTSCHERLLHSRGRRICRRFGALDSPKNWRLQKRGKWVIVYRKGEGVEPHELQTFPRHGSKSSVTGKLAAKQATLWPLHQLSTPEIMQMHNAFEYSASVNNH